MRSALLRERRDGGGRDRVRLARSGHACTWVRPRDRTTGSGGENAVERGPGAAFDQRFTSGDVKEVPYGTSDDNRSIRSWWAFVNVLLGLVSKLVAALIAATAMIGERKSAPHGPLSG